LYSGERILALSGYLLVMSSVASFGVIVVLKFLSSRGGPAPRYQSWLELVSGESHTLILLVIAVVAALLGQRLLTNARMAFARTIPSDDLPLVQQAVMDGKPEPIDQYVRLRSLSGWAGNFTKLGITGLPLTTVFLTLIFSVVSLFPFERGNDFLDLAKLTLGAFIGSFVQRQVEQRRHETTHARTGGPPPPTDLVA
jgi:hypothetical protein